MDVNLPGSHRPSRRAEMRRQQLINHLKDAIPTEHGRVLTLLSTERLFLLRATLAILLQTLSIASLRLTDLTTFANFARIRLTSAILIASSILVILYAGFTYFTTFSAIQLPRLEMPSSRLFITTPIILTFVTTIITLYALMSQKTHLLIIPPLLL